MIPANSHNSNEVEMDSFSTNSEKLLLALRAAQTGLWEWDMQTNEVIWSDNVVEILGISPDQFDGRYETYLSLLSESDQSHIKSVINESILTGKSYAVEHKITYADGSLHWLECAGEVFRNDDGEPIKMAGTIRNISASKRIELEKTDWKLRYELVVASSGQVIYDYNLQIGSILWSGNIYNILGYTEAEMGDINNWEDHIHPDDRINAIAALTVAQKKLGSYDVNYRFRKMDGEYLYIHDRGFFIANERGEASRMMGMMIDITKHHSIEAELRESEHRFKTLQQASFGGIALHDKGLILDCNQGLARMTGYAESELVGMNGLELIAPEYRDLVMTNILSGYEQPYDVEGIRKDGSRYSIEVHAKNVPYKGKDIRVTEFRNITERKKVEAKIIEQNANLIVLTDSLRRKNNQLEEFTGIVSHNLRSPIGNVVSLLALLSKTTDPQEQQELSELITRSSNNILGSLDELNEVLKIKQDQQIEKQNLRFESVYLRVRDMLHTKIQETGASFHTDFQVAEILYPNIYLESVLLNLLSNSLKYHDSRRLPIIKVSTYFENENLILSVEDNGLGMDLKRYGHQLFKLRKTFHNHPEGRGVGLFLVKNQIEALGGTISASSKKNEGTRFTIDFGKQN